MKTSTGFGPSLRAFGVLWLGSANVKAVQLMSQVAKKYGGKVKAAGGIRCYEDAVAMIEAGAYPWCLCVLYSFTLRIVLERAVVLRLWMRVVFVAFSIWFVSGDKINWNLEFGFEVGVRMGNP